MQTLKEISGVTFILPDKVTKLRDMLKLLAEIVCAPPQKTHYYDVQFCVGVQSLCFPDIKQVLIFNLIINYSIVLYSKYKMKS